MTDRRDTAREQGLDRAIDELELRRATKGAARMAAALVGAPDSTAAERVAFLERYPFESFWADLEKRRERSEAADGVADGREGAGWWARLRAGFGRALMDRRLAAAVGAAGIVLVAGVLWFAGPFGGGVDRSGGPAGDGAFTVRPKGPAVTAAKPGSPAMAGEPVGLSFFVRRGEGAVPGAPEAAYREGDQFRFTYWSGENDYLLLLSMEEDGTVSVYYPDEAATGSAGQSVAIERGRNVPLEGSVVLNDYVGRERFFALFSTRPIPLAEVRAAAVQAVSELRVEGRDLRSLERLPIDVPQATFWIDKVSSPTGPGRP